MREVIIHYHLFKNAGTSVDKILADTFGQAWAQIEGEGPRGNVMPSEITELLERKPEVKAVSSHQALLPLPEVPDGVAVPIVFIRHPLDRARSVYWFERKQKKGSPGAEFASTHTFGEYVRWRLDQSKHGVIHNFQTSVLLRRPGALRPTLDTNAVEQAVEVLRNLEFFGIVERLTDSMTRFHRKFPDLIPKENLAVGQQNTTRERDGTLEERLLWMKCDLGTELFTELKERNRYDLALYERASELFDRADSNSRAISSVGSDDR